VRVYGTNADITRRKRAEEELSRREKQHSAVAGLSLLALRGDGLEPLFKEAAILVSDTLGVEYGMVLEWLPEKETMAFRAGSGPWVQDVLRRVAVPAKPGFMAWAYMHAGEPVVVKDLIRETRFAPCDLLLTHGIRSAVAVPIGGKARPFGVLEAGSRALREFNESEVSFVWSMASVLGSVIEQRRASEELRKTQEQLRALSRKLITAQEAERRAVARELHDDFGQVLTAVKLNLMRKEQDSTDSIALVDGAIARMHDLAQDLRPPLLDELGLTASLRSYVEREARRAGLEPHLSVAALPRRFAPTVETSCFRIAQEALSNVIRHASATGVWVRLGILGDVLELEVRDDGRGFDPVAAGLSADSQGLVGMRERVALAGGELEVNSAPGQGASVRARFFVGGEA
jgi:signal transduction histidine kinase